MKKLLCIKRFPELLYLQALLCRWHIPDVGDAYEVYHPNKCDCGCGTVGYTIPEVDTKITWLGDHFIEVNTSETEETETGKIKEHVH